jgi:2-polyprenyl-3-methyl-5-hydroxy-6-metoxy-1,4-benzoquinol methylase
MNAKEGHRTSAARVHLHGLSNTEIVFRFADLLRDELAFRTANRMDAVPLRSYYSNLFMGNDRLIPLGILGYAQRLGPALDCLRDLPDTATILDTGAGYGTESLLFALLGKGVVGVELVPERALLAQSRIPFYQAVSDTSVNIRFENANVFRFLEQSNSFDVIWAMEAISHIYPPEAFFRVALSRLKPGGRLIISDPNSLNPLAWLRSARIRGSVRHVPHRRFRDPETGTPIDYGQEQIFSVFRLKLLLASIGFSVTRTCVSGFLCTSLLPRAVVTSKIGYALLSRLQQLAMSIPVIRGLGSVYTMVAAKRRQ